jgi:hypothetical protein
MNGNALKGKSTIKVKETMTGGLHDGIGFSRTDGWIMPQDEHYAELEKNGYKVEKTSHGVIITKITDNE